MLFLRTLWTARLARRWTVSRAVNEYFDINRAVASLMLALLGSVSISVKRGRVFELKESYGLLLASLQQRWPE